MTMNINKNLCGTLCAPQSEITSSLQPSYPLSSQPHPYTSHPLLPQKLYTYTVVSWVSAHGRSAITPYFSLSWALTRCTGCLPCTKLCTKLVGGVNTQSRSRLPLDSAPVLYFSQGSCSFVKHRSVLH